VSGGAGTGKTTIAATVVAAACARGERAAFVSFEESPDQLVRNLRSVGIDLGRWRDEGLLTMWSERATSTGLESHLGHLQRLLDETTPAVVVIDAIASLSHAGMGSEVTSAVTREMDLIKSRGITGVLTALSHDGEPESSGVDVSSLIDTWLLLRNVESDGERNRLLFVIKSRGTAHSNQVREFVLTDRGAELVDVYVGNGGVLTGSARDLALAGERMAVAGHSEDLERQRLVLARRSAEVAAQVNVLQEQLAAETAAFERLVAENAHREGALTALRTSAARQRDEDVAGGGGG
jgi:circadian clock protein KaiC